MATGTSGVCADGCRPRGGRVRGCSEGALHGVPGRCGSAAGPGCAAGGCLPGEPGLALAQAGECAGGAEVQGRGEGERARGVGVRRAAGGTVELYQGVGGCVGGAGSG